MHLSPRAGFTFFTGVPNQNASGTPGAPGGDGGGGGRGGGRGGGGGGGGQQGGPGGGFNATAWTIRGGVGEFRGKISSNLVAQSVDATGLVGGQSQLSCIGNAVPTPDWTSYLADVSTIPTQCLPSGGSPTPTTIGQRRNVTTFANEFSAPKVWRSSLGASRRFFQRYNFSVDGSLAYGVSQTGSHDLNLDNTPKFALANEGGRPVYSAAAAIFPSTRAGVSGKG